MVKRAASDLASGEEDFSMQDGYLGSMQESIMSKSGVEKDKGDACALLSALDPRSGLVDAAFLTPEFATKLFYPCLVSSDLNTVMEAANTVKTWLCSACDEESRGVLRKMYALQLTGPLLKAVANAVPLVDGFVNLDSSQHEPVQDLVESLLAICLMVAENLEVSLAQLNRSALLQLILAIYEKRQFLKEQLVVTAAECLCVVSEENPEFHSEGALGIRLYSLLLNLPQNWTTTKAFPLSLRSLLALSSVHAAPADQIYEKCLDDLCSVVKCFFESGNVAADTLSCTFETIANMLEEVDPDQLAEEDKQRVLTTLELTCKAITKLTSGEPSAVLSRAFGALTNLLVLALTFTGENINMMIWAEAFGVWLRASSQDDETLSGWLTVTRLLQLNLKDRKVSPADVQMLVTAVLPFKILYQPAILVILGLLLDPLPAGLETIINELIPGVGHSDPEYQEDLTSVLDEAFGDSIHPLSIRLQQIMQHEDN